MAPASDLTKVQMSSQVHLEMSEAKWTPCFGILSSGQQARNDKDKTCFNYVALSSKST